MFFFYLNQALSIIGERNVENLPGVNLSPCTLKLTVVDGCPVGDGYNLYIGLF